MASFEMDMTSGKIGLKLLKYSIPLMLSGILQLLYNAFDIIVLGQFSSVDAMAAVSSTSSLVSLFVNFFLGLTLGSTILMSRYYAAKDINSCHKTVSTTMITSVIVGAIVSVVGALLARYMLILMDADMALIDMSTSYLQIYFGGIIFNIIYNFGSSLLRAVGDTKRPLIYLTLAGILNVCFNLLFVCVFKLDVAGVALGTIISEAVSATLVVITLVRNKGSLKLDLKELKLDKQILKDIFIIGIPASLQSVIFNISNVMIQANINSYGKIAIAGNGVSSSLEGFPYAAMNAVYQAQVSFVSQNVGANKVKNVPKITFFAHFYAFMGNLVVGGIILLFPRFFVCLYNNDPDVFVYANERLLVMILTYFLCGFMDVCSGGLRGLGYSSLSTIMTIVGIVGFRIGYIYTIYNMNQSLFNLYLSYPISWLVTWLCELLVLFLLYKKILNRQKNKISEIKNI